MWDAFKYTVTSACVYSVSYKCRNTLYTYIRSSYSYRLICTLSFTHVSSDSNVAKMSIKFCNCMDRHKINTKWQSVHTSLSCMQYLGSYIQLHLQARGFMSRKAICCQNFSEYSYSYNAFKRQIKLQHAAVL